MAPANRSLPCNAGRLEQEPGPPLGLVDPVLDQAGAGHVLVLVANRVGLAQARRQLLVVVAQLREHVEGGDEVRVVVQHALQAADVADRAQRGAADLAHALGNVVGGRENLLALLVEEEMVVTEVRARHMPMEILGLQIKRKHIGEQDIERAGNLRHGVGAQVGRRIERGDPQRSGILCLRHLYLLFGAIIGAERALLTRGHRNRAGAERKSDRLRMSPSLGNPYMRCGATNGLIVLAPSCSALRGSRSPIGRARSASRRSDRSRGSTGQIGRNPGALFGKRFTTAGSILTCCATRSGGVWVSQSESEISSYCAVLNTAKICASVVPVFWM